MGNAVKNGEQSIAGKHHEKWRTSPSENSPASDMAGKSQSNMELWFAGENHPIFMRDFPAHHVFWKIRGYDKIGYKIASILFLDQCYSNQKKSAIFRVGVKLHGWKHGIMVQQICLEVRINIRMDIYRNRRFQHCSFWKGLCISLAHHIGRHTWGEKDLNWIPWTSLSCRGLKGLKLGIAWVRAELLNSKCCDATFLYITNSNNNIYVYLYNLYIFEP